jgi:hypothetical protein
MSKLHAPLPAALAELSAVLIDIATRPGQRSPDVSSAREEPNLQKRHTEPVLASLTSGHNLAANTR